MTGAPADWAGHYSGDPGRLRWLRHYGYSDRIRYYWPRAEAESAVERLMRQLGAAPLPAVLISQFLARSYAGVREGRVAARPQTLVEDAIGHALEPYRAATATRPALQGTQSRRGPP